MTHRWPQICTAALALVACSPSAPQFSHGVRVPPELESCAAVADAYVKANRTWAEKDYGIRVEAVVDGKTVFRVTYAGDLKASAVGSAESFELTLDCEQKQVLQSLRYQ